MSTNVEAPVASTSKKYDSLPALLKSLKSSSSENVSVPDDIDDPNSTSFSQLLSLTTQSLDDLRTQPAALHTASSSLESQLSNLCSRHVSSFVRVHSASSALPGTLDRLDVQLDKLIDHDLQVLSEAAQEFPNNVEVSLAARNKARNLLDQYETSLKDLLDIPRLLITCAKANHPIEALQLGIHMAKIARADAESGQKSVTVKALKEECWTHLMRLREDLLRGLGARGVRLPAARRYVSLLQRLHDIDQASYGEGRDGQSSTSRLAISQSAICLSFLRSRWILVEDLGAHDSDEQVANILSSQISSWRDLVGDTCNIAMALFGDKDLQTDTAESNETSRGDEPSPLSLISSFGYRSISKLEQLVSRVLPSIDGKQGSLQDAFETLASLHLQLSYSAASLSRQGLDFSDVSGARKAFETQSLELWSSGVKGVVETFENSLGSSATLSVKDLTGSEDVRDVLRDVTLETIRTSDDWSLQVSFFPPLAALANGILDIHDAFVSFAPISIGKDALKAFDFATTDLLAHMLESFRKADSDQTATSSSVRIHPLIEGVQNDKESKSKRRSHEATITIAARFLATLSESLLTFLRSSTSSLFEREFPLTPSLISTLRSISEWTNEVEQKWKLGEEARIAEVKKAEDDRLATEEAERKRFDEENRRLRQEEEERMRLAEETLLREEAERKKREEKERLHKEEEEKKRLEQERVRKEEEEKRLEEERLRKMEEEKRLAEEREKKRIEDEKKVAEEEERKRQEEAKRKEEEEAKERAEEERRKREEEERQKEEERKRLEEEEERKKRLAEEEERKKQEAEEEEKKRQAEENEKKRLAQREQKRLAEEESRKLQEEEDRKKAEEAKAREEEAKKIEAQSAVALEKQNDGSHDTYDSKQTEENEGKTSNAVSEDEDESKEKSVAETSAKDKKKKKKKKKKGSKTPDLAQGETMEPSSEVTTDTAQQDEKASNVPQLPQEAATANKVTADAAKEESSATQEKMSTEEAVPDVAQPAKEDKVAESNQEAESKAEEAPKQPVKANSKLAEKLRKRQEERDRAAAAAASKET
ncbi:uncharacterized protein FA14DRAFT_173451 [Meira miltonrushii]|uniref:Conserved oligomeric Golgi complex subunit 8 n=1 Tax=Meira miltonrushii TaxID=1280837 RepID=A0A316V875_9BASI|nr:uncharacterized protein FA14DRAFT_173451 [Meira miltonrushii]PWN33682.1 hypothetical protein FA14DRAFT_173451 [Meira miltonrushii]